MPGGSLGGEAELAIQRALSFDPNHPKALWLEASHAYEEHRYSDALTLWKRLRATLREDSPDAGIVDANIAESAQLARTPIG
jgi:cytochrome c-type biogenesis protein CcmH/NrfG